MELEECLEPPGEELVFPGQLPRYQPQWRLYDQAAGHDIFDGVNDITSPSVAYNYILNVEVQLIRRGAEYARTILEIGCGMGHPAVHIAAKEKQLLCMERAPRMVSLFHDLCMRQSLNILLVHVDAVSLPLDTKMVDMVYLCTTLSATDRPLGVLCEVRRVLKPGGTVLILEPNIHYLLKMGKLKQSVKRSPGGVIKFSRQEIIEKKNILTTFHCNINGSTIPWKQIIKKAKDKVDLFSLTSFQKGCSRAAADVEWRFGAEELAGLVKKAGFRKVRVSGYGLMKRLFDENLIVKKTTEEMLTLCKLEASVVDMLNPFEMEMLFCAGEKPMNDNSRG